MSSSPHNINTTQNVTNMMTTILYNAEWVEEKISLSCDTDKITEETNQLKVTEQLGKYTYRPNSSKLGALVTCLIGLYLPHMSRLKDTVKTSYNYHQTQEPENNLGNSKEILEKYKRRKRTSDTSSNLYQYNNGIPHQLSWTQLVQ